MRFRIRSRWWLAIGLGCTQVVILTTGFLLFSGWLDRALTEAMRRQVLVDNEQIAIQMARMIDQMALKDISMGSPDWKRLQATIEGTSLPNDGFLCVIDTSSGELVCHPELRKNDMVKKQKLGMRTLHQGWDENIITASQGSGWSDQEDGTHLIAVRDLPGFPAVVCAHQKEAGIRKVVTRIVRPLWVVGLILTALVSVLGVAFSVALIRRYENRLATINAGLEQLVASRTRSLLKTRNAVIFGLAKLAENRDTDTGKHLDRIRKYVIALARSLKRDCPVLDDAYIANLALASSLHDIGKVAIPDAVLLKPGRLDEEERQIVQQHARVGAQCLQAIMEQLGEDDFLEMAHEIAMCHHEHWNGQGYPGGLSGEDIPLSARIVALADVYDALRTERVYKPAMSHEQARRIILGNEVKQFDPLVIRAFLRTEREFQRIALSLCDAAQETPVNMS